MPTRRSIYHSVLVLILLIAGLTTSVWAADRKIIGIADFATDKTVESSLAPTITSLLSEDIVTNRSYYLLNQPALLQKLSMAGVTNLYEQSNTLQFDQLRGLHFLVTGIIKETSTQIIPLNGFQQLRARVLLTIRVFHVPAAQVVYAETVLGEARQTFLLDKKETDAEALLNRNALLETAAKRAIAKVSAKLHSLNPVTGVVLQVNATNNTVIIDLGSEQHVAAGQNYMLYEEGAVLVHPATNLELGRENKEIATVRISKVDTLQATAVIVKGQISDVIPGLQVKQLPNPQVNQK